MLIARRFGCVKCAGHRRLIGLLACTALRNSTRRIGQLSQPGAARLGCIDAGTLRQRRRHAHAHPRRLIQHPVDHRLQCSQPPFQRIQPVLYRIPRHGALPFHRCPRIRQLAYANISTVANCRRVFVRFFELVGLVQHAVPIARLCFVRRWWFEGRATLHESSAAQANPRRMRQSRRILRIRPARSTVPSCPRSTRRRAAMPRSQGTWASGQPAHRAP